MFLHTEHRLVVNLPHTAQAVLTKGAGEGPVPFCSWNGGALDEVVVVAVAAVLLLLLLLLLPFSPLCGRLGGGAAPASSSSLSKIITSDPAGRFASTTTYDVRNDIFSLSMFILPFRFIFGSGTFQEPS